jgi:hypothetical protein
VSSSHLVARVVEVVRIYMATFLGEIRGTVPIGSFSFDLTLAQVESVERR